ncbi:Uricase-2 isozyme 1 [Vigna angularis]|uniref:Uricase-2 isozyme 1 n=1 Tax=Phaseolus angularis TaxID=3914 RepID=A0A8T0KBU6_PHAAN|nr:Uricase-2 isozyme 1 [Vigna angularis]
MNLPHSTGFKLGSEKHTTEAMVQKSGSLQLTSGIEGLSGLNTTQASFPHIRICFDFHVVFQFL